MGAKCSITPFRQEPPGLQDLSVWSVGTVVEPGCLLCSAKCWGIGIQEDNYWPSPAPKEVIWERDPGGEFQRNLSQSKLNQNTEALSVAFTQALQGQLACNICSLYVIL